MAIVDKKGRECNIELLKIVAIFMIIICHSTPDYVGEYDSSLASFIPNGLASANFQFIALNIFKYFGQIGNCIFIICSSYFLLESKSIKPIKIMNIVVDTWFFSYGFLFLFLLFLNISAGDIIKSLFPLIFSNNWFVGAYLLIYLLHPLLNIIIEQLSKRQLLIINIVSLLYFSVINIIWTSYFRNLLISWVVVYFVIAYMKKYLIKLSASLKKNICILCISTVCLLFMILTVNFLGLHIDAFSDKVLYWNKFENIFVILISISLFNLFRKIPFNNHNINKLSSLSLLIYIIHENLLVRKYCKPIYWDYIYNQFSYDAVVFWALILAIVSFGLSCLLASIYKVTLSKCVMKICERIVEKIRRPISSMIDWIMRIN